jgi:hypothetical protein
MVLLPIVFHELQVTLTLLIVMKTGAAVVASLDYVQAASGGVIAEGADHLTLL